MVQSPAERDDAMAESAIAVVAMSRKAKAVVAIGLSPDATSCTNACMTFESSDGARAATVMAPKLAMKSQNSGCSTA